MTKEQLAKVLNQRPFQPFALRMADGRAFLVRHPDFIAMSPSGRTVAVYGDDDACSILDLLLANELDLQPKDEHAA